MFDSVGRAQADLVRFVKGFISIVLFWGGLNFNQTPIVLALV